MKKKVKRKIKKNKKQKSTKLKACSLRRLKKKKIDKPLARLIKKKRRRIKSKIKSENGETTADNTEIQRIKETTISNYMPIKWTIWRKWTNS